MRPASSTDLVADLARALGLDPFRVAVAGRVVAPHQRLVDVAGLRHGARLALTDPTDLPEAAASIPAATDPAVRAEVPAEATDRSAALEEEMTAATAGRAETAGFAGLETTSAVGDEGVEVAVIVGPGCTPWRALGPGRHLVGRGRDAAVRIDDPRVEVHAGFLDIGATGVMRFVQLTGALSARVDGRPCGHVEDLTIGTPLDVGGSRLVTRRPEKSPGRARHLVVRSSDPWRLTLERVAVRRPADPPPITAPARPEEHPAPPATPLIGGLVGVVGSLALGIVIGNPLFAAFALFGATASIATWAAGRLATHRRRRRARAIHETACVEFRGDLARNQESAERRHRARNPPVSVALSAAGVLGAELWQRRVDPQSPLRVSLGVGDVMCRSEILGDPTPEMEAEVERCARLADVSVPVTLPAGSCTAIRGPGELVTASIRSFVLQAATWYGPADLAIEADVRLGPASDWLTWLPHVRRQSRPSPSPEAPTGRFTLRVTSPSKVGSNPRVWRQTTNGDVAVLVCLREGEQAPAWCDRVLDIGCTGRASWTSFRDDGNERVESSDLRVSGIVDGVAETAARALAALVDPEAHDGVAGPLPTHVPLGSLVGSLSESAILDRWRDGGADVPPRVPIGIGATGTTVIDLVRDGPHALIAGTTGSGKSELLRSLVLGLAASASPEQVTFVLVDYKGGATFDSCARLPHVVGLVTDLDDGLAPRALTGLDAELARRERLLRSSGVSDLPAYRAAVGHEPLPRLVVVVDEFAGLAKEVPEFLGALVATAQRGRSLGIHLVLATQRPAGVVSDAIRANTDLRIALRLNDVADAVDVVGDPTPARFPRAVPGRLAVRRAGEAVVVVQSACSTTRVAVERPLVVESAEHGPSGPTESPFEMSNVDHIVDAVIGAARSAGLAAPKRPWMDPLPHPLRVEQGGPAIMTSSTRPAPTWPDDAVGIVDDPARQARHPLRWRPEHGSLALLGSVGAGVTSTAIAVVTALCRTRPPDDLELYVVDACGDDRLDAFASVAHCGGVVRPHDSERVERLLIRLTSEIDRRRREPAGPGGRRLVLLVVDGLSPLRTALAEPAQVRSFEMFDRVLREGPAVGVVALLADHGTTLAGGSVPVADRWVFERCDPAVKGLVGGAPGSEAGLPGRLRIASSGELRGLEAQVAIGADGLAELPSRDAPMAVDVIRTLPSSVDRRVLPPSTSETGRSSGVDRLSIGLGAVDLGPDILSVAEDEHILVLGAAASGVTTALHGIAAAWRETYGDASVVTWPDTAGTENGSAQEATRGPAHGATPAGPRSRQLLLVDDAHRVADGDGELARIAAGERPGVVICAGARLEALRSSYGHWTRELARNRCGLVMTAGGPVDGDVFGVGLPQRTLVAPRPGLAWVIDRAGERLVQIATSCPRSPSGGEPLVGLQPVSGGESPSR